MPLPSNTNSKKKLVFLMVLFLTILSYLEKSLSQEKAGAEGEGVGQSVVDILKDVLPANPNRIMELDEKTGRLFIQDTPSNHKVISQIIKALDKEPSQIDIETRFVELKLTDADEFGFNWGSTFIWYDWGPAPPGSPVGSVPGNKVPKWRLQGMNPTTRVVDDLITFTTTTTSGLDLSIAKLNTNKLDLFLHALEEADKANLLSSPRVTTIGGQLANIQITTTYPYIEDEDIIVDAATNTVRYEYKMAETVLGIKLEVRPTVGEAGIITLELHPEVEVLLDRLTIFAHANQDDLGWPVVDTRSCQTTVQIKSGETVVMGGLMDDDHKVYDAKVPVLGDIPLLGNLFRNKYVSRIKKNLLIFVTATLVNPSGEVAKIGY